MKRFVCGLGLAALLVGGCNRSGIPAMPPAPDDPTAFLKWSMDRYASLPNFQSMVVVSSSVKGAESQNRTFRYESPNKFRVEAKGSAGSVIDAISDGTHEQDYDNLQLAKSNYNGASPASIAEASSPDMLDPSLCGSLIYGFFGGSKNFDKLVKGPVKVVETDRAPDGEPIRVVEFDTPGLMGHVKAAIGQKHGFVYALNYDLTGAAAQIKDRIAELKGDPDQLKQLQKSADQLVQTKYTELFMNIRAGGPLSRGSFDPNLPGATAVAQIERGKSHQDTPIPLNEPAPDVTLKTLDGRPFTLSSLRGHPVMIDFWATWCAPCRASLPETAKIQAAKKNGLQVLAVTDEQAPTVQDFLNKQNYKLTACRDEGDQVQKAFMVGGLPSQVFIDGKGNVIQYLVGFHPAADVYEALKSIGVS